MRVLEGAPKIDDERMLHSLQHLAFIVGVLDLFCLYDLSLAEDLDRVKAQVVFAANCGRASAT